MLMRSVGIAAYCRRQEGRGTIIATYDRHAGRHDLLEAIREVEDGDWERAVERVLRRKIADGRNVRLLYLLGREASRAR